MAGGIDHVYTSDLGQPAQVGKFVNTRVPVLSFTQVKPDAVRQEVDIDVGARWGQPADLKYKLQQMGGFDLGDDTTAIAYPDEDEEHTRFGYGVKQAVGEHGEVLAESPDAHSDIEDAVKYQIYTVFDCGHHEEYTEETSTVGNLTIIDPIITTVHDYVQWDLVETFWGQTYASNRFNTMEDHEIKVTLNFPDVVRFGYSYRLPPKRLNQGTGPQRSFDYELTGCTTILS